MMDEGLFKLFGIERNRALEIMEFVHGLPWNESLGAIREKFREVNEREFAIIYLGFNVGEEYAGLLRVLKGGGG